jgi:hypothetical protein
LSSWGRVISAVFIIMNMQPMATTRSIFSPSPIA